ncbi:MAG: carboxymuconolactone decarboxylase family protein [Chloroflexota bacterium]
MPRIRPILDKSGLSPADQAIFDSIIGSRGKIVGPFPLLMHSPEVAGRTAHLGAQLRFSASIPKDVTELVIITTAREMDCAFEWGAHVILARQVGVREEAIAAIRDRKAPAGLTPDEAQVVSYVQAVVGKHRVDDASFQAMQARFVVQGIIDLTATSGYYAMLACTMNAFEMEPAPDHDPLPL